MEKFNIRTSVIRLRKEFSEFTYVSKAGLALITILMISSCIFLISTQRHLSHNLEQIDLRTAASIEAEVKENNCSDVDGWLARAECIAIVSRGAEQEELARINTRLNAQNASYTYGSVLATIGAMIVGAVTIVFLVLNLSVAEEMMSTTRSLGEGQNRAYVSVSALSLLAGPWDPTDPLELCYDRIKLKFTNSGLTPATDISIKIKATTLFGLRETDPLAVRTFIAPEILVVGPSASDEIEAPIDPRSIPHEEMLEEWLPVTIFHHVDVDGSINYRDVFGNSYSSPFKFQRKVVKRSDVAMECKRLPTEGRLFEKIEPGDVSS